MESATRLAAIIEASDCWWEEAEKWLKYPDGALLSPSFSLRTAILFECCHDMMPDLDHRPLWVVDRALARHRDAERSSAVYELPERLELVQTVEAAQLTVMQMHDRIFDPQRSPFVPANLSTVTADGLGLRGREREIYEALATAGKRMTKDDLLKALTVQDMEPSDGTTKIVLSNMSKRKILTNVRENQADKYGFGYGLASWK